VSRWGYGPDGLRFRGPAPCVFDTAGSVPCDASPRNHGSRGPTPRGAMPPGRSYASPQAAKTTLFAAVNEVASLKKAPQATFFQITNATFSQ
jgi:hypothetical protein